MSIGCAPLPPLPGFRALARHAGVGQRHAHGLSRRFRGVSDREPVSSTHGVARQRGCR